MFLGRDRKYHPNGGGVAHSDITFERLRSCFRVGRGGDRTFTTQSEKKVCFLPPRFPLPRKLRKTPLSRSNLSELESPAGSESSADIDLWVDRYGDALFRYAIAKTGDRTTAEDLLQDTFVAAVSGRKQFRNQSTVSTWLFAILKRKIADHYRKIARHPNESGTSEQASQPSERSFNARDWAGDPAKICEDREFWMTFDSCVKKLPKNLAEVFILREIYQQSPKEIRERLGISATNLSMRLHRCRLAIRDCLNKNWFQQDS